MFISDLIHVDWTAQPLLPKNNSVWAPQPACLAQVSCGSRAGPVWSCYMHHTKHNSSRKNHYNRLDILIAGRTTNKQTNIVRR